MLENWLALYVSIINPTLSPDKAMIKMGIGLHENYHSKANKKNKEITEENILSMIKLREQNIPFKEISKLYGISCQNIYAKIKKYKEQI
jgi:hypothetical protein